MKKNSLLISTIFLSFFVSTECRGSWFIDADRFQSSVHAENSCLDCHETVAEQELHPNPEDINRTLSEFFNPDQCANCHPETLDEIKNGTHGHQRVEDPKRFQDCIGCHDPHYQTRDTGISVAEERPELSEEDRDCMVCHSSLDPEDPKRTAQIAGLCFNCHGNTGTPAQAITKETVPLIDPQAYESVPHAALECTACHLQATAFPHSDQTLGDCRRCHAPHDEKVAHAAHLNVSCEACHLTDIKPVKDGKTNEIVWTIERNLDAATTLHQMTASGDTSACKRCHYDGNTVGAAAMVLPAKSILCMPCHAATFSIGDTTTILSLAIFLIGIVAMFSYLLTGSIAEFSYADWLQKLSLMVRGGLRSLFSDRFQTILAALFFDVFLQRRLYRQSLRRWLIHALIFFPFVIRFLWGFIALLASIWFPAWMPAWDMVNKNNPLPALLFELTGLMIITGIALMFIRTRITRPERPKGLPEQDFVALGLIAGIVGVGFFLEGMRIAMTGWPQGSAYGFLGYIISHLFSTGPGLNRAYGYVWYLHAILTGAFIAYIPFSRLSHIILAPVTLAMHATMDPEHSGDPKESGR